MKEINGNLTAKGLKIALVASRFNSFLVEQLVKVIRRNNPDL